jgi:cell division protein FtsB
MILRLGVAVFGLLTLAIMVLTLVSERGLLAVWERQREFGALQERILQIETENASMLREIEGLKDPDAGEVERRAREELKMVRPGEVILALPPEPGETPTPE